jgi:Ni,Fe-hydrogenase III small subunit
MGPGLTISIVTYFVTGSVDKNPVDMNVIGCNFVAFTLVNGMKVSEKQNG